MRNILLLHCRAHEALREKMLQDIRVDSQGTYILKIADLETVWQIVMRGSEGPFRQQIFECVKVFVRQAMWQRTKI